MKADAVLEKIRTEITKQLGPDKVGGITVTFDEKEWGLLLAEIAYLRSTQETYVRLYHSERDKSNSLADYLEEQARATSGMTESYGGHKHTLEEAIKIAQAYVDAVGLCVTITPTTFVYKLGVEEGVAIGLINYPRFPSTPEVIRKHAVELASVFKLKFAQNRVSIVFPEDTVMLGEK